MQKIDVFNGDADGICALHQLRLAQPASSLLITGVKRDIGLLEKIKHVTHADIVVLDISLDANRDALNALLEQENNILYFDHHYHGEIPVSAHLNTHLDMDPDLCTSLLVDRYLGGTYREWAIVAAFGDNLHKSAHKLATDMGLSESHTESLRELGELINYNGYGESLEDLLLSPDQLYLSLVPYEHPCDFIENSETISRLRSGFNQDRELALSFGTLPHEGTGRIVCFPSEAWAKRIAGVYNNEMSRKYPEQAQALLVENHDGSWMVSVRAPQTAPVGADLLCRQFPTGGGRAKAAGINQLPAEQLKAFIQAFDQQFS
ncbi:MAG: acetyltransferase [SAR324 cluster bacterium]|nr:acetyltransferase [SAR324 cluster bacterium]